MSKIRRDWLTLEQAAEHLGVCERTIRRYVADGRLTGYRLGPRLLRFDGGEVDALARPVPTARGAA